MILYLPKLFLENWKFCLFFEIFFYLLNSWSMTVADGEERLFDGNVDVLDVVTLVIFILLIYAPSDDLQFWLDMNQDEILNIQDVILIINLILN